MNLFYYYYYCQAAKRGILSTGRGRGMHTRGRGVSRGRGRGVRSRGRGRGLSVHAVVDHRPRALEISAFTENDREDLLPHFAVCTCLIVLIILICLWVGLGGWGGVVLPLLTFSF